MIEELIEGKLIEKLGSYYWWRNKTNDLYGTDIEGNILVKIIRRGVNLYVYNRPTNKSFKYEFNKNEDLDAIMKIGLDLIIDELLNNFDGKFNTEFLFNKGIKSILIEDHNFTNANSLRVLGDVNIMDLIEDSKNDICFYLELGILLDFTIKNMKYRSRLEVIISRLSKLLDGKVFVTKTITSGRVVRSAIHDVLKKNIEITKDHLVSVLNGVISSELSFTRKEIEDTINNL